MFCKKCGNQLADTAQFCGKCGAVVQKVAEESKNADPDPTAVRTDPSVSTPKPEKPKMKKSKKILLVTVAGVLVVVIAVVAIFLGHYFSAEQKLLRALEEEDYDAALGIYREEMEGEESDALVNKLEERISAVRDSFTNSLIDYTAAKEELSTIRNMRVAAVNSLLSEVESYVNELNSSRTAFNTAESLMKQGNYVDAIEQYGWVSEIDSNYSTAQTQITAVKNAYRDEILSEAAIYASESLYAEAIEQLQIGLKVLPQDAELTEQLYLYETAKSEQETRALLDQAAAYVEQGDYPQAIHLLQGRDSDAELNAAYKKYCQDYEAELLSQADTMIAEKNYDGAIALLNKGLNVLSQNANLINKRSEAEAKRPVSLATFTAINGGWTWNNGSPKDPFGNDYSESSNYFIVFNGRDDGKYSSDGYVLYAEYRVYGEYNRIEGVIAPYTSIGTDDTVYIQIYADEVLVYTSPEIHRKTDVLSFSVDISGAEYIKIRIVSSYSGALILSDVMLCKDE